jgi:hypothetical protein
MNLDNLNIEQLVEIRTKMVLEGKDTSDINFLIDIKESEYFNSIFEDSGTGGPGGAAAAASIGTGGGGVAYANGQVAGMGPIVSSQPSSNAGVTLDPAYGKGGGKSGSGDIGVPYNAGGTKVFQKEPVDMKGSRKRRKNKMLASLKGVFANKQDWTAAQAKPAGKIMNFDNFAKTKFNKVTKVNQ